MRDHVEGDLLGELLRFAAVADEDVAALFEQLIHARLARARDRLIGRDDHALDRRIIVQRLERDDHLRRRAVRVRDDVALGVAVDRLRVHLRHDQRNIRVHAIERRIVDHRATGRRGLGRIDRRRVRSDREQRHIPAGPVEMLDVPDLVGLVGIAERNLVASRTRRRDQRQIVNRKLTLRQDVEHLATDIPGRAGDNYTVTHFKLQGP